MKLQHQELILDIHNLDIHGGIPWHFDAHVKIMITDFNDIVSPRFQAIRLQPGAQTTIRYSATVKQLGGRISTSPMETRACRKSDELVSDHTLFMTYEAGSCAYEIALKNTFETIMCIPWDFIHPEDNIPICTRGKTKRFKELFQNMLKSRNVSDVCIPSCHDVIYDLKYDVTMVSPAGK